MKAGKYSLKDLFVNRYIDQIIIPEIQRDYVWGNDQVKGILESILKDYKSFLDAKSPLTISNDEELEKDFSTYYNKRKYSSNIGFIYAYNDKDFDGKYFLIDGQQRITTIYLLLLVLASRNEELKESFKRTYLINGRPKLDYKVREGAHEFLGKFVTHILINNTDISDQNWYYSIYLSDPTICNLVQNHSFLHDYIDKVGCNELSFYRYLEDLIEFWYFDTNVSEQGEELYIYMNARGEQMQENENIKADLLGQCETILLKNNFGKEWEEWQDFFWIHRDNNTNADKGFNEFLTCISGLENYLYKKVEFYDQKDFERKSEIKINDLLAGLSLEKIKKHIEALQFLEENKESFKAKYNYSEWIDKSLNVIWDIINNSKTNWFADYTNDNRATERRRMVFVWSVLHFIVTRNTKGLLHPDEVFRILRIYYIRFNNNIRAVNSISKNIEDFCNYGPFKAPCEPEENLKHQIYNELSIDHVREYEELIWEIEDHKFNIDGRDVGNTNISYLLHSDKPITLQYLAKVKDRFYEIFPEDQSEYKIVQQILLHYGDFWYKTSPYYYCNYEFNNWRRIIRNRIENKEDTRETFKLFFIDFIDFEGSVEDFLNQKLEKKVSKEDSNDLRLKLLWYSQQIGTEMWGQGNYIAISLGNYCGLPDYINRDKIFASEYILYNTKGDLKGGSPVELYKLLPESQKNQNSSKEIIQS